MVKGTRVQKYITSTKQADFKKQTINIKTPVMVNPYVKA